MCIRDSVKVDALGVVQGMDRLDVLGGVGSVLGVGCIGKGAAVHVVDDGAGARSFYARQPVRSLNDLQGKTIRCLLYTSDVYKRQL